MLAGCCLSVPDFSCFLHWCVCSFLQSKSDMSTLIAADFSGATLVAGAYTNGGACSANRPVVLDCAKSRTGFTFTIAGALNINTDVTFKSGVSCPVLWKIGGAVEMSATGAVSAANSHVVGNVEAIGAISIYAYVHLAGTVRSQGLVTVSLLASTAGILPAYVTAFALLACCCFVD
jgi:hypothetical protein